MIRLTNNCKISRRLWSTGQVAICLYRPRLPTRIQRVFLLSVAIVVVMILADWPTTAAAAVVVDISAADGAKTIVANPGETVVFNVSLRSDAGERVAGLRYTLEFGAAGCLVAERDYATSGWVSGDDIYDTSVPPQGAAALPVPIDSELWAETPDTADIRFSSVRAPDDETEEATVETLRILLPADALPGIFPVGFGNLAAYEAGGEPLTMTASAPLAISVNSRQVLHVALGEETMTELVYGRSTAASADFDQGVDLSAIWPPPPDQAYAVFVAPPGAVPGWEPLLVDFRPREALTRWRLHVHVPPGRGPATLSWPSPVLEPGVLMFLQELIDERAVKPPLDMSAVASVTANGDAVFEIVCGFPQVGRIKLAAGWNLIGVPLMTTASWNELLTHGRTRLTEGGPWLWRNGSYRRINEDEPPLSEYGYWVFSPGGGTGDDYSGLPADGRMILGEGWHPVAPGQTGELLELPANTTLWQWRQPLGVFALVQPGTVLEAGLGYWGFVLDGTRQLDMGRR